MKSGLDDKHVAITGAAGGIGWALAEAFAAEGARLSLFANRGAASLRAKIASEPWGSQAQVFAADVADRDAVNVMFEQASASLGRVDICIANAGIWPPESADLDELSTERVEDVLRTNLLGAMWTSAAFMATLRRFPLHPKAHGASLCLIGSTAAEFGEAGHAEYSVSKAGLIGLMRSCKNEIVQIDPWARVNLVQPGWTVTPMAKSALQDSATVTRVLTTMPLRQLATPHDVAASVLFFSSPVMARHLTGQTLTVAGGMEGRRLWTQDQIDLQTVQDRMAAEPGETS